MTSTLPWQSRCADPKGGERLIANPYRTWQDVNADLPAETIEVLGPPPTSGRVMPSSNWPWKAAAPPFLDQGAEGQRRGQYKTACHTIREDGRFVEAGENDNLIVQKLKGNPRAVGIFGFSFLEQNMDTIKGAAIDGVDPAFESIADGSYPISRPLFVYVKKAHVGAIPGIREFLAELTSTRSMGDEGYLADRGLVPLPADEYRRVAERVKNLEPMTAE